MEKYVSVVQKLIIPLKSFTIKQIPRGDNMRTDAISKLILTCFGDLSKKVLVEVLKERSINEH